MCGFICLLILIYCVFIYYVFHTSVLFLDSATSTILPYIRKILGSSHSTIFYLMSKLIISRLLISIFLFCFPLFIFFYFFCNLNRSDALMKIHDFFFMFSFFHYQFFLYFLFLLFSHYSSSFFREVDALISTNENSWERSTDSGSSNEVNNYLLIFFGSIKFLIFFKICK